MDDTYRIIRELAKEQAAKDIASGAMILPPDPIDQAKEEAEKIRSGKKKVKRLKRWKNCWGRYDENVYVFGSVILVINEYEQYAIYDRFSRKRMWKSSKYEGDSYELAIRLSLLTDWEHFEELSEAEQQGVLWRLTEITWETGESNPWELFAKMDYELVCAAETMRMI